MSDVKQKIVDALKEEMYKQGRGENGLHDMDTPWVGDFWKEGAINVDGPLMLDLLADAVIKVIEENNHG